MLDRFKTNIATVALIVGLTGGAIAGQFEDGVEALGRGDYPTATRLLGPLAEKGDTRAQIALGVGPAVKGYTPPSTSVSPFGIYLIFVAIILAVSGATYARLRLQIQNRRIRRDEFLRQLPPEVHAEINHARQIAAERPWTPIAFKLDSIEMTDRGVRFHANGEHLGHAFSFGLALTMSYGPVAVCEWYRDGDASEGLIDILAYLAGVPRGDSHFDELVKTSLIILRAAPPNVPFAQVASLRCKVFFEFTEDNPEIYLDLDFAEKTGLIREKNPMDRKRLVYAFQANDQRESTPL
ncbi:hypothetical protein H8A95_33855 [Bradyrhizobium sp. Pear76]|uniref:hypothetical protein n=1 Tax=Bradyrhizobium oropedii TaxID=1571201 RepID=UPI001E292B51|nr:hypothetical protein [Bradyrhizobium oropedii]MCC8967180.1 hypothetical protein [Bradyrhizobium oropedii]